LLFGAQVAYACQNRASFVEQRQVKHAEAQIAIRITLHEMAEMSRADSTAWKHPRSRPRRPPPLTIPARSPSKLVSVVFVVFVLFRLLSSKPMLILAIHRSSGEVNETRLQSAPPDGPKSGGFEVKGKVKFYVACLAHSSPGDSGTRNPGLLSRRES